MVVTLLVPITLDRVRFNADETFNAPDPVAEFLIARGQAIAKMLDGPPADKLMKPAARKAQAHAGKSGVTLEDS